MISSGLSFSPWSHHDWAFLLDQREIKFLIIPNLSKIKFLSLVDAELDFFIIPITLVRSSFSFNWHGIGSFNYPHDFEDRAFLSSWGGINFYYYPHDFSRIKLLSPISIGLTFLLSSPPLYYWDQVSLLDRYRIIFVIILTISSESNFSSQLVHDYIFYYLYDFNGIRFLSPIDVGLDFLFFL